MVASRNARGLVPSASMRMFHSDLTVVVVAVFAAAAAVGVASDDREGVVDGVRLVDDDALGEFDAVAAVVGVVASGATGFDVVGVGFAAVESNLALVRL